MSQWTVSDILSLISIIFIAIGGIFGLYQWRNSIVLKRAEYIHMLIKKFTEDEDIREILRKIDYNKKVYKGSFEKSKKEYKVDKTLAFYSYVCYLLERKILSKDEFHFIAYDLNNILHNSQIREYLRNLYHESKERQNEFPYSILLKYGMENGIIGHDFYD